MRIHGLLFVLLLICRTAAAQTNTSLSSSDILLKLKKLNTIGSVLYIAAHPDDENTRLLPYLANERNLRTGYLSITRGDGGQNLIGKEQAELLGLIRTQELLAARRIDGAEQYFTRANDFGYSKNPEETFAIWNKDSILSDMVWVIRQFKPDVIITRFPTTGEGGHGHHTASAILAIEAFDAAADPTRFPEQLAYTEVWQTKRLFWNTFNFGGNNTTSPDQIKIDAGGYNALLGKSYGEIASANRSMHKSQGFGTAATRGPNIEYFKQLKGDSVKTDLFEGINESWTRFPATAAIKKSIDKLIAAYNPQAPEKTIPGLVLVYKQLQALNERDPMIRFLKNKKMKEAEALLIACSGLYLEATASDYTGIPGKNVVINVQMVNRSTSDIKIEYIKYFHRADVYLKPPSASTAVLINYLETGDSTLALIMKQNESYTFKHVEALTPEMPYSGPYWLVNNHETGLFSVANQKLIGKPEYGAAVEVSFTLTIAGLPITVTRDLVYKYTDPVRGEVYRPFEVLPPVTVNMTERAFIANDNSPKKIRFIVKANTADIKGMLQVKVPAGWTVTIPNSSFTLTSKGDEAVMEAIVTGSSNSVNGKITASVLVNGITYTKSISRIEYDHIPYQFILSDAEASLVYVDVKKAGNNIGYIPGAGDEVVTCLRQIGYNVTILTDEQLTNDDLSVYGAIVTGIRAYNTNDKLQVYYQKLMNYVQGGGNLVVQYNTNNRIGPLLAKIGPYPFTISRDRVTNEQAEVRILDSTHSVFNYPNHITQQDFSGWIQERGIYFATDIDSHYQALLSMNDPGEKPTTGSLIVAPYGKGNFVYTGLAFFRELPAGVPGSYRLFANLLSLPEHK